MSDKKQRIYCCIDLKSFYASVECVERGLDPFKTNLIVADPDRTTRSVCLAITPAMKELGVNNRCRVYQIPPNIEYITAKPRMKLYMKKSAEIYGIYLRYISPDDIHVYSVDECFIDLTDYVKLYKTDAKSLAKTLTEAVFNQTGIRATVGIGTNLFLAKIALDITAKHSPDFMGYLDEDLFKKTLWHHRPITDFWNIGPGIARRLADFKIYDLYSVSIFDEKILYKEFGVNAELLIDHSKGIETCTIADIKAYKPKSNSLSNSQILFSDYNSTEALTIVKEMTYQLILELNEKELVCDGISLYVGYSNNIVKPSGGSKKLSGYTDSIKKLSDEFVKYYLSVVDNDLPIRKITVGLNNVVDKIHKTYDLFTDLVKEEKEENLAHAIVDIKNKYGKNALLKGISYSEKATARERNKMVGGHFGGEDD